MAAQKGSALLLKLDKTGTGTYITIAGLRTRRLVVNAATIDTTNADSASAWRELLSGGGVKSASLSGSGVFSDEDSDSEMQKYLFAGTIRNWQIIIPNFGTITGKFQLTSLEFAGEFDGEMTYQMSLDSAGALTFAKAV